MVNGVRAEQNGEKSDTDMLKNNISLSFLGENG